MVSYNLASYFDKTLLAKIKWKCLLVVFFKFPYHFLRKLKTHKVFSIKAEEIEVAIQVLTQRVGVFWKTFFTVKVSVDN